MTILTLYPRASALNEEKITMDTFGGSRAKARLNPANRETAVPDTRRNLRARAHPNHTGGSSMKPMSDSDEYTDTRVELGSASFDPEGSSDGGAGLPRVDVAVTCDLAWRWRCRFEIEGRDGIVGGAITGVLGVRMSWALSALRKAVGH